MFLVKKNEKNKLKKKYFWLKKISFPKKNNFPEIYFLVVKYRVFVQKKTLSGKKNPYQATWPYNGLHSKNFHFANASVNLAIGLEKKNATFSHFWLSFQGCYIHYLSCFLASLKSGNDFWYLSMGRKNQKFSFFSPAHSLLLHVLRLCWEKKNSFLTLGKSKQPKIMNITFLKWK